MIGLLLGIPKLREKSFRESLVVPYRLLYVICVSTLAGDLPSWFQVSGQEHEVTRFLIIYSILALVTFFGIFTVLIEYHYFPFGRGFLLFILVYFNIVVLFYKYYRTAVFTGRMQNFYNRYFYASLTFVAMTAINSVVHRFVQNGMKADYNLELENNPEFKEQEAERMKNEKKAAMQSGHENKHLRLLTNILTDIKFPEIMK